MIIGLTIHVAISESSVPVEFFNNFWRCSNKIVECLDLMWSHSFSRIELPVWKCWRRGQITSWRPSIATCRPTPWPSTRKANSRCSRPKGASPWVSSITVCVQKRMPNRSDFIILILEFFFVNNNVQWHIASVSKFALATKWSYRF